VVECLLKHIVVCLLLQRKIIMDMKNKQAEEINQKNEAVRKYASKCTVCYFVLLVGMRRTVW